MLVHGPRCICAACWGAAEPPLPHRLQRQLSSLEQGVPIAPSHPVLAPRSQLPLSRAQPPLTTAVFPGWSWPGRGQGEDQGRRVSFCRMLWGQGERCLQGRGLTLAPYSIRLQSRWRTTILPVHTLLPLKMWRASARDFVIHHRSRARARGDSICIVEVNVLVWSGGGDFLVVFALF